MKAIPPKSKLRYKANNPTSYLIQEIEKLIRKNRKK